MNSHKNNNFKFQPLLTQLTTKTILFVLFLIYGSIVHAQVYINYEIINDERYGRTKNEVGNEEVVWKTKYRTTNAEFSVLECDSDIDVGYGSSSGYWWRTTIDHNWGGKCLDNADALTIYIEGWENDKDPLCEYNSGGINPDDSHASDEDTDPGISNHPRNTWERLNTNEGKDVIDCSSGDYLYQIRFNVWWNYSIPVNPSFSITNVTANSFTINKTSDNNYRITNWDYQVSTNSSFTEIVKSGTVNTLANIAISGLIPANTYYIRIRGTNESGTGEFTSYKVQVLPPTYPIVSTNSISNIAQSTATSGGNVTYDGGTTITNKGVCWSTVAPPLLGDNTTSEGSGSGAYTSQITELSSNTNYFVRAYATNSVGTVYGAQFSFITLGLPAISSELTTSITGTTAIGNGNITYLGNPNPSQYGVCWSTNQNPTIAGSKTEMGAAIATGAFQSQISGLTTNTLYYAKAYATNSQGTVYGIQYSFRTLGPPTIETNQTTTIAGTNAVCNGTVINLGNPNPTQHGVCWSTGQNPTTSGNKTEMGANSFEGAFQSKINNLETSTLYYVRAYATNTQGTAYGSQISFTTLPFPGDGSSLDPFQISTLEDLRYISEHTDYWNKDYIQTADIDASSTSSWNEGEGWVPIGNSSTKYIGIYDGNDHTISNLNINRPATDYCGLFGAISAAEINNLGLINVNIIGHDNVGGLLGDLQYTSTISNCYTTGSVNGNYYVGGLSGFGSSDIQNSFTNIDVSGNYWVGGFIGEHLNGEIINCYSQGTVIGEITVGGFIGYNHSNINKCFSISNVSSQSNFAGFAGSNNNGSIKNCYYIGSIDCSLSQISNMGAFVGISTDGRIENSYVVNTFDFGEGTVLTSKGFIGNPDENNLTTTSGNVYNSETSGQITGSGAVAKTSAEMKNISSFVSLNWDFVGLNNSNIWDMDGNTNSGYPYLSNQKIRKEWIGTLSHDPSLATNWQDGDIPINSDNILLSVSSSNSLDITNAASSPLIFNSIAIENGATLNIKANKALTISSLLFNNGSVLIESNGSGTGSLIVEDGFTGSVTTQRYMAAANWGDWQDGWHFISSPVANYPIQNNFTVASNTEYDFYAWSEPDNLWINFKDGIDPTFEEVNGSANIKLGTGYLVAYQNTDTKSFTGTINLEDVNVSNLSFSGSDQSWHLLGNPFNSAILWDASSDWNKINIAGTAQIWNEVGKSYSAITAGGIIPTTNGFMVQVSEGTGSLTIPKTKRTHSETSFYKNPDFPIIKLKANNLDNPSFQETQLLFNPQSTDGYEMEFDSDFLPAYAPQFYSLIDERPMAVNSMPQIFESTEIPLSFIKNEDFHFSIEMYEDENIGFDIWLLDKKLNKDHNLSRNPTYVFTSNNQDDENRFVLHFLPVGIGEIDTHQIQIWYSNNTVNIINSQHLEGEISLVNLLGQNIAKYKLTGDAKQEISLNGKTGFYIINVNHQKGSESIKVILR